MLPNPEDVRHIEIKVFVMTHSSRNIRNAGVIDLRHSKAVWPNTDFVSHAWKEIHTLVIYSLIVICNCVHLILKHKEYGGCKAHPTIAMNPQSKGVFLFYLNLCNIYTT